MATPLTSKGWPRIHLIRILITALFVSGLTFLPQIVGENRFVAQGNVSVPESATATTLFVSPPAFRVISSGANSIVMDFSEAIGQPTSWDESTQRIAIEIAITSEGGDSSPVFRGGGCVVDLSSDSGADAFNTTAANGSNQPVGVDAPIFVLNDATPQLTINGVIDDVLTAIRRVQIRCTAYNDLRNKFVRIGAVPTEDSSTCNGANADTICQPLYYLFSSQHYYRAGCSNTNATTNVCQITGGSGGNAASNTDAIINLRDRVELLSIGVDGTNRTGGNRRAWVTTLTTRDEIVLTNSLGGSRMIGTTDLGRSWSWNPSWGGSASNCSTSEGTFRWLGPDAWCELVPAQNYYTQNNREYIGGNSALNGAQSRYWRLNGSLWEITDNNGAANGGVDFRSTTTPTAASWSGVTNGTGFAHFWHTTSGGVVDEPNSSGDYIYMGYDSGNGLPGWDDAGPGDADDRDANGTGRPKDFYAEFCSPAQPCTPPDVAVASTEILPDQTMSLRKATTKLLDAQSYWTFPSELSFGATVTDNLVVCISETQTANYQLRFSILNTGSIDASAVISQETITATSDAVFESAAAADQTLIFEGPRAAALRVYNGGSPVSSPLRIWKPLGTFFNGSERVWVRVIARSAIGRPLSMALCRQAATGNSWVIALRPYVLQQTTRQGEVKTKP